MYFKGIIKSRKGKLFISLFIVVMLASITLPLLFNKNNTDETVANIGIVRHPSPFDYHRGLLESLPKYDESSTESWQVDLRGFNMTELNLLGREADLYYASFDSKSKWPNSLPESFNPIDIMEIGKKPGLNITQLHDKGINGSGVGIAIIDQTLLVDHTDYRDSIKMYEEINIKDGRPEMHGAAVSSIAVGKNTGVAPKADLYYIAQTFGQYIGNNFEYDFNWTAKAIDRILEVNKALPKEKKIRVISISVGWDVSQKGYEQVMSAVERAKKDGVFVVSSSLHETFGFKFNGLGRSIFKDPNDFNSYEPGLWWRQNFYENPELLRINTLLIPMDSRTTASPTGVDDFVFYRQGGWSWSIPYIAGLYALACQVKPDITPDVFWNKALETGTIITITHSEKDYKLGKIVNPVKLIEEIMIK